MAVEETVGVGGDSTEAVRALDRLKDKAGQVSRSLANMATQATMTGLAVVGLDSVVAVLQRTVEFASASISAFTETDRAAGQAAASSANAYRGLQVAIGSAALGGDNARIIFGAVNQILGQLTEEVLKNEEALQELTRNGVAELIDATSSLLELLSDLATAWEVGTSLLEGYNNALVLFASNLPPVRVGLDALNLAQRLGIDLAGEAGEAVDRLVESHTEAGSAFTILSEVLDNVADGMSETAAQVRAADVALGDNILTVNQAIERYGVLNALFSTASTPPPSQPRSGAGAGAQAEAQAEAERLAAKIAAEKAYGTELAEVQATIAAELQQKADEREALRLEAEATAAEERARIAAEKGEQELARIDQNEAKKLRTEQEALAGRQAAAQDAAASSADLMQGLMSGQEKASKTIKKFLGSELQARGRAFLIEGAATIAVPGLQGKGAALLAGGAAMMAGGALLAGSGGGGGGGTAVASGAAPIPSSQSAGPSTAVTNQVSFGIVGDPRAAAALVADSTRNALREGYAVGAA